MSENNVDVAVIRKTQDILGKYVKKPALTDKLLNKPPFRFLHDIVNAVIKETGFFDGLYSKTELNSENIKDRDAKIKFLQKLIDVIKLTTNDTVAAKPSKIVAGHEADKTNELLQHIGLAINNKLDFKEILGKYKAQGDNLKPKTKSKEKDPSTTKANKSNDKKEEKEKEKKFVKSQPLKNATTKKVSDSKSNSKPVNKSKDASNIAEKKIKPETKETVEKVDKISEQKTQANKSEPPVEVIANSASHKSKASAGSKRRKSQDSVSNQLQDEYKAEPIVKENTLETGSKSTPKPTDGSEGTETENIKTNVDTIEAVAKPIQLEPTEPASTIPTPNERKKNSGNRRKSIADDDRPDGSGHKTRKTNSSGKSRKSSDPALDVSQQQQLKDLSATLTEVNRQSTFVREDSQTETKTGRPKTSLRPPSVRPASARPGAPRRRDKNVEIILQPNDQVKLAGINVKLENFESQLDDDGENLVIVENVDSHENEQRHETDDVDDAQQGHLVQQILQTQKELTNLNPDAMAKTDIDVITLQKRQSSARQMDSLRDVIQNLTRSINPLGKLMDFLPEDIDSMHLELNMWRDSYIQASGELKKEKSLTESAVEPMKNQLAQITSNIKEYKDMIEQIRMKILQNSDKIHKLLIEQ